MELRPYQEKALSDLRASVNKKRRSILSLATGGGKTIIAAAMVKKILSSDKKKRIFFCVHRRELVSQTTRTLEAAGVKVGHIAAGWPTAKWMRVQVCSIPTLARRLGKVGTPHVIIVDEAHHAVADSWSAVVANWPKAFIIGLTATPERGDGRGLGEIFNDIVHGVSMRELMDDGFLADPEYYSIPTDMANISKMRMGEFDRQDMKKRADNNFIARILQSYKQFGKDKQALFFGVSVEHAMKVRDQFRNAGYISECVDGTMNKQDRDSVFRKLHDKGLQILTSCELISEGFDCPDVGCVIMGRPTASMVLFRQQAGRVMRPGEDKTILDLAGNVNRHGLPWAQYNWSLNGSAGMPGSGGDKEGQKVWQCESCYMVNDIELTHCRKCGEPKPVRRREIEEKDILLSKVNGDASLQKVVKKARQANRNLMAIGQATRLYAKMKRQHGQVDPDQFRKRVELIAERHKYKKGWVDFACGWVIGKKRGEPDA